MVQNAILAIAAGRAFGLSIEEAAAGLASTPLTKARLQVREINGVQFLDDSYNANPDSMQAALRTLVELDTEGKRIAVLGHMGELGVESERGHSDVGKTAAELQIDHLITVGEIGAMISRAAQSAGLANVTNVATASDAAGLLGDLAAAGDLVLVKGSRSARMELVLDEFAQLQPAGGGRAMMYQLHLWSEQMPGLNVFTYVTFRSVAAAITAFIIALVCGNFVIRKLISLKIGQPIRTAAEVHRLAELHGGKQGVPTMGGVLIIAAVFVASVLWAKPDNRFVWLALFAMTVLGGLGFADDYLKVTKKKSDGISGRYKLLIQLIVAGVVTVFFLTNPLVEVQARSLYLPFFKAPVIANMGFFTFVFFAIVIAGGSNAVNLTDGLDGLATGCTITVAFAYALLTYAAGNFRIAEYLQVPFYRDTAELTVVCSALVGAGLGFLWFNCHPAKVFMGDTGSLAIGGLIAVVAICCKQELLLIVVGGVFVIEAVSVILQVLSFKMTGKRIFLMSPIHHHFELSGWKENTVIVRFWILSAIFALLGLATLKLR
jgi:phospho-N-acetylmuramoyl-pentapeptide-transferase